jgi:hypothetical protein
LRSHVWREAAEPVEELGVSDDDVALWRKPSCSRFSFDELGCCFAFDL